MGRGKARGRGRVRVGLGVGVGLGVEAGMGWSRGSVNAMARGGLGVRLRVELWVGAV